MVGPDNARRVLRWVHGRMSKTTHSAPKLMQFGPPLAKANHKAVSHQCAHNIWQTTSAPRSTRGDNEPQPAHSPPSPAHATHTKAPAHMGTLLVLPSNSANSTHPFAVPRQTCRVRGCRGRTAVIATCHRQAPTKPVTRAQGPRTKRYCSFFKFIQKVAVVLRVSVFRRRLGGFRSSTVPQNVSKAVKHVAQ